MLKGSSVAVIVVVNVILGTAWHFISMILCMKLDGSLFDFNRRLYRFRRWEKNGLWYSKNLKINKWKDKLPQFVKSDGFSKAKVDFNNMSLEYFDRFILETCRGEWCHWVNAAFFVIAMIINPFGFGLLFGTLAVIGNLPFIIIQRYNRARLLKIRQKILIKINKEKNISYNNGDISNQEIVQTKYI